MVEGSPFHPPHQLVGFIHTNCVEWSDRTEKETWCYELPSQVGRGRRGESESICPLETEHKILCTKLTVEIHVRGGVCCWIERPAVFFESPTKSTISPSLRLKRFRLQSNVRFPTMFQPKSFRTHLSLHGMESADATSPQPLFVMCQAERLKDWGRGPGHAGRVVCRVPVNVNARIAYSAQRRCVYVLRTEQAGCAERSATQNASAECRSSLQLHPRETWKGLFVVVVVVLVLVLVRLDTGVSIILRFQFTSALLCTTCLCLCDRVCIQCETDLPSARTCLRSRPCPRALL